MSVVSQDYSRIIKSISFSQECSKAKAVKDINMAVNNPKEVIFLKLLISDSLDFNKFKKIIPQFTNLRKVVIDNFYDYDLKLPQTFWLLSKLEYVSLHNLNIESFNDLGLLNNLKYLSLMGARLKEFPNEILQLKNLEYLDFTLNFLKTIPQEIDNLNYLRELDLTNNCFSEFPISVVQLPKLEFLDFDNAETVNNQFTDGVSFCYNMLSELPDLTTMKALKKINIYKLKVTSEELRTELKKNKKLSGKVKLANNE